MKAALTGWGRTAMSRADVVPLEPELAARHLGEPPSRGVLARGLGRSYGDAAQNAGGLVLGSTAHAGLPDVVPPDGRVLLRAGTSLDAVMRWALPQGWFVPVTPGTRQVTIGGAVAADIHGKNHHRDGAFSRHVTALRLLTPSGERRLAPGDPLFDATAGGMGLTGVILDAEVQLQPVETATMRVDTERVPDLDAVMARLAELDHTHRYTVAWLDLLARGRTLGRGVITAGDHATAAQAGGGDVDVLRRFEPRSIVRPPDLVPGGLLNAVSVAAFNEAWYRKAPRRRVGEGQGISQFFHPLDGVRDWNRLYGRTGLLQYQFAVPDAAAGVVRSIVEDLAAARAPSFLAVLKRFGPSGPGHLSFPTAGWTLAVDLPARARTLGTLLDRFDDRVVQAGGRLYLAKDSRMAPRHVPLMYPRLDEWRAVRHEIDPGGVLASDLDRRLGLTGAHP